MKKIYQYSGSLLLVVQLVLFCSATSWGQLAIYPSKGQSETQQSQDKGECHQWAIKETGVDPSQLVTSTAPQSTGNDRKVVRGAARGAVAGVAIGAIAGDAGKGAAIGATAGGIGGVARQRRDAQTQQSIASQTEAQKQQAMQKYEKAYGACLTGRGYAVQ